MIYSVSAWQCRRQGNEKDGCDWWIGGSRNPLWWSRVHIIIMTSDRGRIIYVRSDVIGVYLTMQWSRMSMQLKLYSAAYWLSTASQHIHQRSVQSEVERFKWSSSKGTPISIRCSMLASFFFCFCQPIQKLSQIIEKNDLCKITLVYLLAIAKSKVFPNVRSLSIISRYQTLHLDITETILCK